MKYVWGVSTRERAPRLAKMGVCGESSATKDDVKVLQLAGPENSITPGSARGSRRLRRRHCRLVPIGTSLVPIATRRSPFPLRLPSRKSPSRRRPPPLQLRLLPARPPWPHPLP